MTVSRPRILIVDDEESIVTMLAHILAPQGYDVQLTTSGIEALYLLANSKFQVMITDINMPKMDGLELTRRALDLDPELAIILSTAVGNRERAYQAYELGAAGYLLKPFDVNEIRIYVANTLRLRELELAHQARLSQLEVRVTTTEAHLQKIVSQLRVVLWALDLNGNFTLSEGRGLEDLGLQPGQVVGRSALKLFGQVAGLAQAIERALKGEVFSEASWVNNRLYEHHYSPLRNDAGELTGTTCFSLDITQTHQLQIEATRKSRLASLGELAAGVAHEINNPNALVLLNSQEFKKIFADIAPLLAERYQRQGDFKLGSLYYSEIRDDLSGLLENIVESAQRIRTIVSDLRYFASEDKRSERETIDFNQIVRASLPFVERIISDSTLHFSIAYSPKPLFIHCMPKRLEQVVINLLQNACQALPNKNAGIEVSLTHDRKNRLQILTIKDEGCGISAENLERIKEPFFTTRRNSGGTGLGLSVSTQIVEECGGSLEFVSTLGVGTSAILTMPAINKGMSHE